jgi:hypothetical protein
LIVFAAGALVYGRHVQIGGFYNDDWSNASAINFRGFGNSVHAWLDVYPHRPLQALYIPGVYALFGAHPWAHIASSIIVAAGASTVLFVLLRRLGLMRVPAMAIAVLTLLFPWSDGVRLWATAGLISASVALFLGGVLLGMHALRTRSLVAHAGSLALYLISILLYEIAAPLLVLLPLAYLCAAPRRAALWRWLIDIIVVGGTLVLWTTRAASAYPRLPLKDLPKNIVHFADQALTIAARAIVPLGTPTRGPVLILAALALLAIGVLARRPAGHPLQGDARTVLVLAILGIVVVVLGYATFAVGEPSDYQPRFGGAQNRVNEVAGLGYCAIAVAVWWSVVLLARAATRDRWAALSTVALPVALLAVTAGYAVKVNRDRRIWDRSANRQTHILAAIWQAVPDPSPTTTIVTFGHPQNEGFGIPVIGGPLDESGAVQLHYRDRSLRAFGVFQGTTLSCEPGAVVLNGNSLTDARGKYTRTVFVDVTSGRRAYIHSAAQCRRVQSSFPRGPVWQNLVPHA